MKDDFTMFLNSTVSASSHNDFSKEQAEDSRVRRSSNSNYRKQHQCPYCESSFVREDSLRAHLRQHSQKKVCILRKVLGTSACVLCIICCIFNDYNTSFVK